MCNISTRKTIFTTMHGPLGKYLIAYVSVFDSVTIEPSFTFSMKLFVFKMF